MKLSVVSILIFASFSSYAQRAPLLTNLGNAITLSENSLIIVKGDFENTKGSIDFTNTSGSPVLGRLEIKGSLINKDNVSHVFEALAPGVVALSGGFQDISGWPVRFPSLVLGGTTDKTLKTNIEIGGVLFLGSKQLKAENFVIHITNPNSEAIIRGDESTGAGSGFISTTTGRNGTGVLLRDVGSSEKPYLFPLGSSENGTVLYRPVHFTPSSSESQIFSASLIDHDPSNDGYDKSKKRYDVKTVSNKYYYLLGQKVGTGKFDVTFYQNSKVDNNATQLVNWTNYLQWEKAAPSNPGEQAGEVDDLNGGVLNTSIKFSSIEPFNQRAFTFSSEAGGDNPFTFFNAFSPDGDNRNDTWTIKNIELYQDNKLTIYNRWGDEVYSVKGYTNEKAWDGGNLQPGTYYYVLTATIKDKPRVFKGFITMVKKN
jgi:gliding motility-associated-like protein